MNALRFQRQLADIQAMPWKNGGGVTRELLAWPNGSDWSIRVSVADIEQDGPFSAFPGVDRYFAVLEGDGVELEALGTIRKGDAAVKFDGAIARTCRLLGGKTRDLNVMIRRDRGHGYLRSLDVQSDLVIAPGAKLHGTFTWPTGLLSVCEGEKSPVSIHAADARNDERIFHFAFWNHTGASL